MPTTPQQEVVVSAARQRRRRRASLSPAAAVPSLVLCLIALAFGFLFGKSAEAHSSYRQRLFGGGVDVKRGATGNNKGRHPYYCEESCSDPHAGAAEFGWAVLDLRGGRLFQRNNNNNSDDDDKGDDPNHGEDDPTSDERNEDEDAAAPVVGVKSHNSNNHKKSNAVGDPDGEGSSDDDDDDDDDEDLSDWDMLEDVMSRMAADDDDEQHDLDAAGVMEHMHVAVEYVDGNEEEEDDDDDDEETEKRSRTSGGVGIRLGQRFKNHRQSSSSNKNGKHSSAVPAPAEPKERHLIAAWQPHVYLPPPSDLTYLKEHARTMDGDGKTRLDRRTLYAGLLLEWSSPSAAASAASSSSGSSSSTHPTSYRKFLEKDTSQALQAALSLATQPAWRKAFPRPSGIRLYNNEDEHAAVQGCTLAMQESIAKALVRSTV